MTFDKEIEWMKDLKKGDEDGFRNILQRYENPVINFSYRFLQSREAAEDVAQEVFLAIYRQAKDFTPGGKLSTWIFTIAHRKCIDFLRKQKVRKIISLDFLF